jgi:hypothetical protein
MEIFRIPEPPIQVLYLFIIMKTSRSRVLKIVIEKLVIFMNCRNKRTSNSSFMKKNTIAELPIPILRKKNTIAEPLVPVL